VGYGERTTSGLANYKLDLVIFDICNSVVLWFGLDQHLCQYFAKPRTLAVIFRHTPNFEMANCKLLLFLFFLTLFSFSCSTSKETFDNSIVNYGIKKQKIIQELAEYAIAYTIDKPQKLFSTDTLSNKDIKKKFNRNGYGGLVTVTYKNIDNNKIFGLIDSTVIFKQTTLKGVTEIIYDFGAKERQFEDDKTNSDRYVFLTVTNRIYYRRRPIPMM